MGADKAYDTRDFVDTLRAYGVRPHVAQNVNRPGGSTIDGRTARHESYAVSQRKRPLIEKTFGWMKQTGGMRKTKLRRFNNFHRNRPLMRNSNRRWFSPGPAAAGIHRPLCTALHETSPLAPLLKEVTFRWRRPTRSPMDRREATSAGEIVRRAGRFPDKAYQGLKRHLKNGKYAARGNILATDRWLYDRIGSRLQPQ